MMKKNKKLNEGFTLVETLVAISIFTMSLLGLMSIMASGISDTSYAKKKIIADYLAQEGIEYIRNMRDTFVLYSSDAQNGWNNFYSNLTAHSCQAANGCYFNADNLFSLTPPMPMTKITLLACSSSCPDILYDDTTGKYGYAGADSGFSRKIQISQISADEIKVSSIIYWTQGSGNYNITFSEDLFNWVE
jgi:Tfp pilus assembly protein PilV